MWYGKEPSYQDKLNHELQDKVFDKGMEIRRLQQRLEVLEEYLGIHWDESEGEYYKRVKASKEEQE